MWACKNIARKDHDVTLISAKHTCTGEIEEMPSNLHIMETIEPSWEGMAAEKAHYLVYKRLLEEEYGNGNGIVWDNTWHCFSYMSAKKFPKMKIIHTNHGTMEAQKVPVNQLRFPRFMGLSRLHAKYMSSVLDIPIRYVHHGIPLPPPIEDMTKRDNNNNDNNEEYFLSINRIVREKGIEDSIDLALKTRNAIKIAGDDLHVPDPSYVQMIKTKCYKSNGLAEYIGLVDNRTKIELIQKCKAMIACPKSTWIEAFGLYAVEANAYGKPLLALNNGGLNDIIVNGVNGFLAESPGGLERYIDKVCKCSPESCRDRVEKYFTDEIMARNYIRIFDKVMEDEPTFRW
jgi:glycosyltransferase involved in cell wall biosynthesis